MARYHTTLEVFLGGSHGGRGDMTQLEDLRLGVRMMFETTKPSELRAENHQVDLYRKHTDLWSVQFRFKSPSFFCRNTIARKSRRI